MAKRIAEVVISVTAETQQALQGLAQVNETIERQSQLVEQKTVAAGQRSNQRMAEIDAERQRQMATSLQAQQNEFQKFNQQRELAADKSSQAIAQINARYQAQISKVQQDAAADQARIAAQASAQQQTIAARSAAQVAALQAQGANQTAAQQARISQIQTQAANDQVRIQTQAAAQQQTIQARQVSALSQIQAQAAAQQQALVQRTEIAQTTSASRVQAAHERSTAQIEAAHLKLQSTQVNAAAQVEAAHVRAARNSSTSWEGFGNLMDGVGKRVVSLGLAFAAWTGIKEIVSGLTEATIGFNARLEQSHVSWGVFLKDLDGTKGRADAMIAFIQDLALKTQFGFQQIDQGARMMMQGGIAASAVIKGLLLDTLNVSASMGERAAQSFDHITYAFGQIQEAGHLAGQEMRQLYNAGVNLPELFEVMSRQTGKTVEELHKMQVAGTLTSDMFFKAFSQWSKENFGDLALRQVKSFTGAMQQIQEGLTLVIATGFRPFFERLSELAQRIATFVANPQMRVWATQFAGWFDVILTGLGNLVSGFVNAFTSILNVVSQIGQQIYQALQWINPFAHHSPSLVESVEDGMSRIENAFAHMGQQVPLSVQPAADALLRLREIAAAGMDRMDASEATKANKALGLLGAGVPEQFAATRAAIAGMLAEAKAMYPEILANQEAVDGWKRELEAADDIVKTLTADLKQAEKDVLKPWDDVLKADAQEILGWQIQVAEAERAVKNFEASLQPLKDQVEAADRALADARGRLTDVQIELRSGEAGLLGYKEKLDGANDRLRSFQDTLNTSKDALRDVNDELKDAKENLKGVLDTPLEGTAKYREALGQLHAQILKVNAQYLTMKANGATDTTLKPLQQQLDRLRARQDALRAQQELNVTLPEERIKDISQGGTKEISYDVKLAGVQSASSQIAALQTQQQIAEDRARADETRVRQAQRAVTAAKEEYDLQNHMLDQIRTRERLAKNEVDLAELAKAKAERLLELAKDRGKAIYQILKDAQAGLAVAEEQRKFDQIQREQANATLQDRRDALEVAKSERDVTKEMLDDAKTKYDDLKSAQEALVRVAGEWEGELDKILQRANTLEAALKAAAKAGAGAGGLPQGGKLGGVDEALNPFKQGLTDLDTQFQNSQKEAQAFFDGLGATINGTLPEVSGAMGRLQVLFNGLGDTMNHLFAHDVPGALQTLLGTVKEVADGLPEKLAEWQAAFLGWVATTIPPLLENLGQLENDVITWIVDEAAPSLFAGLGAWVEQFKLWVAPAAEGLIAELGPLGEKFLAWVVEEVPWLAEKLGKWAMAFIDWVGEVIEPKEGDGVMIKLGGLLTRLLNWIEESTKPLKKAFNEQWVPAFTDWVLNPSTGAAPKLLADLGTMGSQVLKWSLEQGKDQFFSSGGNFIFAMGKGWGEALWALLPAIFDDLKLWVQQLMLQMGIPAMKEGENLAGYLLGGLNNQWVHWLTQGIGADAMMAAWAGFQKLIHTPLEDLGKQFAESLVGGILKGFSGAVGRLKDQVVSTVTSALNQAKEDPLINSKSPSKYWAQELGVPLGQGVAVGIAQTQAQITAATVKAIAAAAVAAQPFTDDLKKYMAGTSQIALLNNSDIAAQRSFYGNLGVDLANQAAIARGPGIVPRSEELKMNTPSFDPMAGMKYFQFNPDPAFYMNSSFLTGAKIGGAGLPIQGISTTPVKPDGTPPPPATPPPPNTGNLAQTGANMLLQPTYGAYQGYGAGGYPSKPPMVGDFNPANGYGQYAKPSGITVNNYIYGDVNEADLQDIADLTSAKLVSSGYAADLIHGGGYGNG